MPQHNHDSRTLLRQLRRDQVEFNLGLRQILNHFGIPYPTDKEIERALAAEGITSPVKPRAPATGHLSTGRPVVHKRPHDSRPSRKEV